MQFYQGRDDFTRALSCRRDARLHRLLADEIGRITDDLIDDTEILVIEPGDSEDAIVQELGWSPLVEPIDEYRFGDPRFTPHWDWLTATGDGWGFRMVACYGSSYASIIYIADATGVLPELRRLCRGFAT